MVTAAHSESVLAWDMRTDKLRLAVRKDAQINCRSMSCASKGTGRRASSTSGHENRTTIVASSAGELYTTPDAAGLVLPLFPIPVAAALVGFVS